MLDFLFITSPSNARNPHPPYYFMYLAAYLREKGLKVKIIDPKGGDRPQDIERHFGNIEIELMETSARFIGLAAFHSDYVNIMRLGNLVKEIQPGMTLLVGNAHATIDPGDFCYPGSPFDVAVLGEGEETCYELWRSKFDSKWDQEVWLDFDSFYPRQHCIKGIAYLGPRSCYSDKSAEDFDVIKTEPRRFMDLKDLPMPAYDLVDMDYYLHPQKLIIRRIYASMVCIFSGRGCPYHCLAGDSLIDTAEFGKKPIAELVGKTPLVLTRDPETKKAVYAKPTRIFKTQENAELVRVHFTDGTHIDCTPDHRFMALQYRNQYQPRKEWEVEAQDLKSGQSVVACRYPGQLREHRVMMERLLGRPLKSGEQVHHRNKRKKDNSYGNLVVANSHRDHISTYHPEVSERMKGENNTIFLLSSEERSRKSRENNLGKRRTPEQRERYRLSKLGEKNPNFGRATWNKGTKGAQVAWNKGLTKDTDKRVAQYGKSHSLSNQEKRVKVRNHKVAYVERLNFREDVYCMEVPGYDWFFANDILVHNCDFCAANVVWSANRGKAARLRPVEHVIEEISYLKVNYGIDFFYLFDDMFGMSREWMSEWFENKRIMDLRFSRKGPLGLNEYEVLYDRGTWKKPIRVIPYACQTRADIATEEMIKCLSTTGCIQVDIGVETGVQRLLDSVHKGITLRQIRRVFQWCQKYGMRSFATMLLNLPGETREDLQETYRFLEEIKPSAGVIFGVTTPYPGTKIYEQHCNPKLSKDESSLLINNRLNPIERFRMSEHKEDLEELWDRWNRKFLATPMFERMWCLRPFQLNYWRTVFRSRRLASYIACWARDIPKTFLLWWMHKLGLYRFLKRVQYGEKWKGDKS